jgi:hypothetical protein
MMDITTQTPEVDELDEFLGDLATQGINDGVFRLLCHLVARVQQLEKRVAALDSDDIPF